MAGSNESSPLLGNAQTRGGVDGSNLVYDDDDSRTDSPLHRPFSISRRPHLPHQIRHSSTDSAGLRSAGVGGDDGGDERHVDIWGEMQEPDPETEDQLWADPGPGQPPLTKDRLKKLLWIRIRYYVPVIGWLPHYNIRENLQADIIAGITVACLLIPQGLSYAQALVKIPPVYGLYTCFGPLIIYSLLGTSRQLAVGPEALVSILVGAAIREKSGRTSGGGGTGGGGDSESPGGGDGGASGLLSSTITDNVAENIAIANLMCLMVGLFTSILGFFRLGFLDSVLSRALLRGFVTAVAFVVMIDLSGSLLGLPPVSGEREAQLSPIEKALEVIENVGNAHAFTTVISVVSVGFLVGVRLLKAKFAESKPLQLLPEILILVVTSTMLSAVFRWDKYNVEVLKDVQGGFIAPSWPSVTMDKLRFYLISAILISVIGFVESIAVAKTYATKHNYAVSPNRELVALGVANTFSSFFGAWPAFGSLGRSAVNDSSGAKTQVAGFVTGIIILIAIIALLPLFYFLPKAVCSAIIVVAAFKLIELHDVEFIIKLRAWKDFGLLLMTFLSTLLISIEVGTLISIGTSLVLVIKHTTKVSKPLSFFRHLGIISFNISCLLLCYQTRIAVLGRAFVVDPKTGQVKTKFRSITESSQVEPIEGALVIRIEEGLFFGNSGQLKDRLKRVELHGELGVHPGEAPRPRAASTFPSFPSASGSSLPGSATGPNVPGGGAVANGNGYASLASSRNGSLATFPVASEYAMQEAAAVAEEEARKRGWRGAPEFEGSQINAVIFDIGAMNGIDATATQTMMEIVESYHRRNIIVCFVKLRDTCKPLFLRSGLWALVGMDHFFDKIRDALDYLRDTNRIHPPPSPPGAAASETMSPSLYEGTPHLTTPGSFAGIPAAFTVGSWDQKASGMGLFASGSSVASGSPAVGPTSGVGGGPGNGPVGPFVTLDGGASSSSDVDLPSLYVRRANGGPNVAVGAGNGGGASHGGGRKRTLPFRALAPGTGVVGLGVNAGQGPPGSGIGPGANLAFLNVPRRAFKTGGGRGGAGGAVGGDDVVDLFSDSEYEDSGEKGVDGDGDDDDGVGSNGPSDVWARQ
ncbi:Solute carrier 26 [Phlyctochytrium bullatum]|nr:Solute carrier 26 [Phlyctochytrium bullatum]